MKELFGEDFYVECAPATVADQVIVNKRLKSISEAFQVKMVIGTDAHYLKKEDRYVHEAFLNSQHGEREVADFYAFSYLQENEEIVEHLKASDFTEDFIYEMFDNSIEIFDKIERYSLNHKSKIPTVPMKNYSKEIKVDMDEYPTLKEMYNSDDLGERYWVNECVSTLKRQQAEGILPADPDNIYLKRLEEEADIQKVIGEKLDTNMFNYPISLQYYIDKIWECGSIVGAGRGSACAGLNHYLLGVTQLDPIAWEFPYWRYLNKDRIELGDIDIDICPSKRPLILRKIKEERGARFNTDVSSISKQNLGCTLVATFGTEGTKSAVITSCRGYRSEAFPDGIDVDTAQYLSSLIPSERGFLWTLKDVVNGNPDKDRKPVRPFINEVNKYEGLMTVMLGVEGLISRRGSHASGVILYDEDPYEFGCFMKTPSGDVITQWDLHDAEWTGQVKYDYLVTEVSDKIVEAIRLLQVDKELEPDLTLRQIYNKYFHPNVLPIENQDTWKVLQENSVLNIFQFDSDVGGQAAKMIKPSSILEMSDANGLMRLMTGERGEETPMEKYVRFKNDISQWYKEMDMYGLSKEEQTVLEPYFLSSYGVPPSQEQMMKMLLDPDICNFTLAEANAARKVVGKKQMSKIPELKEKVLTSAKTKALGDYVWKFGIGTQMGYAFSCIHSLAYSFIGFQTMFIATNWNPIYWNTACLIINSGALEEEIEDDETKERSTDYGKVAKAIGDIQSKGISISLVDINNSDYGFKPDVANNQILYGLKGLNGVGDSSVDKIIEGRPYVNIVDFMNRCKLDKRNMINLIKAGAFDNLVVDENFTGHPRYWNMVYYISQVADKKKRITLQNVNGLIQQELFPEELELHRKIWEFNKFLKAHCKNGTVYTLEGRCLEFYCEYFDADKLDILSGIAEIQVTDWDKIYKKEMETVKDWMSINQQEILTTYNKILFKEMWDKYALGTLSSYEMDSLGFYHGEHELINVDLGSYGIVNFEELNPDSDIEYFFKRGDYEIPIYSINKIIGTVISKNDTKATIALLTTTGVVTVKFSKEYYAMYKRQLSELQEDGTKKVTEKGWFGRGVKLLVGGYRRGDMFVTKTYKNTGFHQIYKILNVNDNGTIEIVHERTGNEDE